MTRQAFLRSLGVASILKSVWVRQAQGEPTSRTLEPWTPGTLDIHHISTGRGNSTLFVCPDGTSLMVDAGASTRPLKYTISPKPNGSLRPGQWIGRYAQRQLKAAGRNELDYFVSTHFHSDHIGDVAPDLPLSKEGGYRLTGVADVAEILPIRRFIDRDYPRYDYPQPLNDPAALNYIRFVRAQEQKGSSIERIQVGSARQIKLLREPTKFPSFSIRNLAANGEVWTGVEDNTRHCFPDLATLSKDNLPGENMCCLAIRLSYGKFDYYTGGDLSFSTNYGDDPWRDIETPVAHAAGPVDVAVLNHHGYIDAVGPEFVRSLRPSAFVLLAWDSAHPSISALDRILSKRLYPGERSVFATSLMPENKIVNARLSELKSDEGHVVVRVAPGGKEFRVLIVDNCDESGRIKADFGAIACR
jgi:metallo-beta-lactamase superfamily protein